MGQIKFAGQMASHPRALACHIANSATPHLVLPELYLKCICPPTSGRIIRHQCRVRKRPCPLYSRIPWLVCCDCLCCYCFRYIVCVCPRLCVSLCLRVLDIVCVADVPVVVVAVIVVAADDIDVDVVVFAVRCALCVVCCACVPSRAATARFTWLGSRIDCSVLFVVCDLVCDCCLLCCLLFVVMMCAWWLLFVVCCLSVVLLVCCVLLLHYLLWVFAGY